MSKIPCEVIQDLLPLYVDHLTSEVTGRVIREHLSECRECTMKYQRMKQPVDQEDASDRKHSEEIDYLKKYRKSSQRKVFLAVASTVAIALLIVVIQCFFIGFRTDSFTAKIIQVDGGNAVVHGEMKNRKYVYKRHKIVTKDGEDQLVVYAHYRLPWDQNPEFEVTVRKEEYGDEVVIGAEKLLSDGTVISELARKLFQLRNPYIGDMSANGRIALTLGIGTELGQFQTELQTTEQPYGWTLKFLQPVTKEQEESFNYSMKKYACELLALIQNVDWISWKYTLETGQKDQVHTYTMTTDQASDLMDRNIKDYYESDLLVEELIRQLDERMSQVNNHETAE